MKNIVYIIIASVFFISCKSTSAVDNNVDYEAQRNVKGDWIISNIEYPNSNYIQVNHFDIAKSDCFTNSTWNFVSNNNKGTVVFPNNCAATRNITWYINRDGQMVLKFLNSESSRKTETGYVVDYIPVNANSFILRDKAMISNSTVQIEINFTRI